MRSQAKAASFVFGLLAWPALAAGQALGDPGVIEYEEQLVRVTVDAGEVSINPLAGQGDAELEKELSKLAARIETHLAATAAQEERQFTGTESVFRGTNYARKLLAKVSLLQERLAHLGDDPALRAGLEGAAAGFDVLKIKELLAQKLGKEDANAAEAAFQLGGFQELDGEYQDAWGNYQKASNLEPGNQLYMDAHGKNEF